MVIYNRGDIKTMERARGHWSHILTSAGIGASFLNAKPQACPLCREGRDRFCYDNKYGDGNYICRKCGAGTGATLLAKWMGLDPKADFKKVLDTIDQILGDAGYSRPKRTVPPNKAKIEKDERDAAKLEKQRKAVERYWTASRSVEAGDPVDLYLVSRGIGVRATNALRYIPRSIHWVTNTVHPAMLAIFRGPQQQALVPNAQITFLTAEGQRADVKPPRLNLPGVLPEGGAIRLQPAATVMGIAEGVETAMSAAQMFDMPVWSVTSKSMMIKWRAPDIASHITIYADNDKDQQGLMAAESLARRLLFEAECDGIVRTVDIMVPEVVGTDWNDVLQQKGASHESTAA